MAKEAKHRVRLEEIALLKLGELSDEEVLRLLAERTQLKEREKEYILLEQEEARLQEKETERASLDEQLSELNKLISPDKPDDELLHLIKERKEIETKLDIIAAEVAVLKKESPASVPVPDEKKEEKRIETAEAPEPESPAKEEVPIKKESQEKPAEEPIVESSMTRKDEFGAEKIVSSALSSELQRSIDQMKNNPTSLGTILDSLPGAVKKDKVFMLEVAKIDPAYAMHYADAATLKKDEDFNVRVASMRNERHSGNALAEMLPEGRTSKVVLAGVKYDYKNIRFALPNMPEYDEMLEIAKKGALETVKKLKEGVDTTLLVPKILQKDRAFMEQIEKITGITKE